MSRVFLSYSRRDKAAAQALKTWLEQNLPGLDGEIFLDSDPETGIVAGTRWKEALRRANDRCEAVICLLSAQWDASHECKTEYRNAEDRGKPIFPVRLEEAAGGEITGEWERCDLFGPGPMTAITVSGADEPVLFLTSGLRRLYKGLLAIGIAPDTFPWPPHDDPDRSPYRGWQPLEPADAAIYFGRDVQINRALTTIRASRSSGEHRMFVVLGPSGVGKSSFLRAGLLPRLQRDDRHFVPMEIVRPQRQPLTGEHGLARSVHDLRARLGLPQPALGTIKSGIADADAVRGWLIEAQRAAVDRLLDAGDVRTPPTIVLPVDQAEELFGADAGTETDPFLAVIAGLLAQEPSELQFMVIVTIRTDRYELFQTAPRLAAVDPYPFDDLKPMPPDRYREVICGPAARAESAGRPVAWAPELVDRLLTDCAAGADALPLLSLTLARLHEDYGDGDITVAEYEAIGGMRRVIETEIDTILSVPAELRRNDLDILHGAFIPWLATINPANDQPMRRPARYFDLPADCHQLIDKLVARRLLVKGERNGDVVVEVALESLLRQWDIMAAWLQAESADLKHTDSVEQAARAWDDNDRHSDWLLEGGRLAEAEALAAKPGFRDRLNTAREFLLASRQREDRRAEEAVRSARERQQAAEDMAAAARRYSRRLVSFLLVTVVFAAAAGVGMFVAVRAYRDATAQRLIAESRNMLEDGADASMLQQLLAGRNLSASPRDAEFYPMVANAASTWKIMANPSRPEGHGLVPVQSVAVSRDGAHIASGSNDHTVRLWNARTGALERSIDVGGAGAVWSLAFSADGARIVSGSEDGRMQVWDTAAGDRIGVPMQHPSRVTGISLNADGTRIATGGEDGVRIWNAGGGAYTRVGDPGTLVRAVSFSPTASVVASGDEGSAVRLWDADGGGMVAESLAGDAPVMSLAFSGDGSRLAVARIDGTIAILDGRTLETMVEPFLAHPTIVQSVAFSPDGSRIASGGADNVISVWDADSGSAIGSPLQGHRGPVSSVAFTADGTRIVSGSLDGSVRIWDSVIGLPIPAQQGAIRAVAFSPDPTRMVIASGGSDGTVKLWDASTAKLIGRLGEASATTDHAINSLAFDPQGKRIVTAASDGRVSLWDVADRRLISVLPMAAPAGEPLLDNPRMQSVAFDRDGTRIVAGGFDGVLRLWDALILRQIGAAGAHRTDKDGQKVPYQVWSVAFSPDGTRVASGSGFDSDSGQNNLIQLWDTGSMTADGAPIEIGEARESNVFAVGFNPDGSRIVSGSTDGTARVWDLATRQPVAVLSGDQNPVFSVAFAHTNPWIAAGDAQGTVRLWDMVNQPPSGTPLEGHRRWVHSVAFSPDDRLIVSGSADGDLRLWPTPTDVGTAICGKLTENISHKQWREWTQSRWIRYSRLCPDLPVSPDV